MTLLQALQKVNTACSSSPTTSSHSTFSSTSMGFEWGVQGNVASAAEQAIGQKDNESICYVKVKERARSTECNAEEMMYGDR